MEQSPDLFAVALAGAAVLDMLRFHRFIGGARKDATSRCSFESRRRHRTPIGRPIKWIAELADEWAFALANMRVRPSDTAAR
jgi:hypothetical protein